MKSKINHWSILSLSMIFIGILLWGLQFYFSSANLPFWLGTLVFNSAGIVFGAYAQRTNGRYSSLGIVGNTLLLVSIFVVIFITYIVSGP
ncbi:hypothetical protein [Alkalihalobacterium elongatum]|uniref:hypothetical protein n=1 Tax=Alkalihalobacterium elongatum TaxID=2675466 RepID=UPI001C1F70FF|nr:hypothetical protein [Alkalihalobacterium elongatum]